MKNFNSQATRVASYFMMLAVVLCALVAAPMLSKARSVEGVSIIVTNNSSRSMRFVYVSPTDSEMWSENRLGDENLTPGHSVTLSNVSCTGSDIKVIGEDMDGCFVSGVVSCANNTTWTITNDAVPNCGN